MVMNMSGLERFIQQLNNGMAGGIATIVIGAALVSGMLYLQQPSMVFIPMEKHAAVPTNWGLAYEDVMLETDDGVSLHGWYIPREGSSQVVLFFHGNAGNISHRGDSVRIFHQLGFNVFIIDYRGYGKSGGKPSEAGIYEDARTAWRYLTGEKGYQGRDIALFGRSLGGVVAASLAAEVEPGALIVESSFTSARDVARLVFPMISRITVLRFEFPTLEFLARSGAPVMVIHSRDDDIIPFTMGERLYDGAGEPKVFHAMQGDHNAGFLLSQPGYGQALGSFFSTHMPSEAL